jgi:hypothetical protein
VVGSLRERRPSPALVISILALFVSLGGSAAALRGKNTVRSSDIKNGQVKSPDIRNNAVLGSHVKDGGITGADLKGGTISGAQVQDGGISGADVQDNGISGADVQESSLIGVRPYGDVIPSGTTVIGVWGGGAVVEDATSEIDFLVSLPAPAPVALTETTVNFEVSGSGADDDPTCAGTVDAPTAPAGKACLYDGSNVGGSPALSGESIGDALSDRLGFIVIADAPGPGIGTIEAHGTWAYTAP